jgi:hypothetical protein
MKFDIGRIKGHYNIGITVTNYYNQYIALIIDFLFGYVEIVFKDYDNVEN